MAVAFVSSSTAEDQTGATFSVDKPAGAADDDLLVAIQATSFDLTGAQPVTPTGWTLLDRTLFASGSANIAVYFKFVSGDGLSYTFNNSVGALAPKSSVRITCWSGAGTPTQITKNSGANVNLVALGLTTAANDSYILAGWANINMAGAITNPGGMTDFANIGNSARIASAYELRASAGATGDRTATQGSGFSFGTILAAIPPAAAAAFSSTATLMGI